MRRVGREDQLNRRPLCPASPGNVVEISWEVLIGQEGPAVALRPVAEAREAPLLPHMLVRRGGPCVEGWCAAGTEAGIASAVGAATPAGATCKVGSEEAEEVGSGGEALRDSK